MHKEIECHEDRRKKDVAWKMILCLSFRANEAPAAVLTNKTNATLSTMLHLLTSNARTCRRFL